MGHFKSRKFLRHSSHSTRAALWRIVPAMLTEAEKSEQGAIYISENFAENIKIGHKHNDRNKNRKI